MVLVPVLALVTIPYISVYPCPPNLYDGHLNNCLFLIEITRH